MDDRKDELVNGRAPDESLTPEQQRQRAQALDEAGQVISEAIAIFAPLTPRQSAERVWAPGGPSVDELTSRIEESRANLPHVDAVDEVSSLPVAAPVTDSRAGAARRR
ncbi:hypothetical protein ACFZA2_15405 [Microbacterium sp. NPDC007973]|uniref:hypothetical protein n=1 Tax=Microbacterium sp. NPDC007973 TaxID=3364182 RepID=UPI0036E19574